MGSGPEWGVLVWNLCGCFGFIRRVGYMESGDDFLVGIVFVRNVGKKILTSRLPSFMI